MSETLTLDKIAAHFAAKHPEFKDRIVKAVSLIKARKIWLDTECTIEDAFLCVASNGVDGYQTVGGLCSCAARKVCYHRIARRLILRLEASESRRLAAQCDAEHYN